MGIIGAIYGPVVMILLVTSIEVYTKFMLRSDLEALEEDGRIDLAALGLVPDEDQERAGGEMVMTALKNVAARFRPEAQTSVEDDPAAENAVENTI